MPVGSGDLPHRRRAGMVYSVGLRRCLIIFAPQTLVLDRRTQTCRTPSLRWIRQRSKNFTSGAAVSFTLGGPIVFGWGMANTGSTGIGGHSSNHRGSQWATKGGSQGPCTRFPDVGSKAQHNSEMATLGRCTDIPWIDIQPRYWLLWAH